MDKIETVKAVVVNRGRALADKAKELTEVAKLKAQIMSCEEIIRKNYLEIGKRVFEVYEESQNGEETEEVVDSSVKENEDQTLNWEARYRKQCTAIANAKKAIEDLERRSAEQKEKA